MNSAERIQSTLAGQPTDRRAYTAVLSLYGARLINCPLETYFQDPDSYAKGQIAVWETFHPDILFGPFTFADIGAAFGAQRHFIKEQPPNIRKPAFSSLAEWERCSLPDPEAHPQLHFYADAIKRMTHELKGEILVVGCLPPPIDLPPLLFGMEHWMETVTSEPDQARSVMEKLTPWFVRLARNIYQAGAAAIAIPCAYASSAVAPRALVKRLMLPVLHEAFSRLNGAVILHHGGAPILAHVDMLFSLPNVIALVCDSRDSVHSVRHVIGSQPTLITGPMAPRFSCLTPSEVERECQMALNSCRKDRRFILANSGPDLPWSTPPENIHAMRRAVECWEQSA